MAILIIVLKYLKRPDLSSLSFSKNKYIHRVITNLLEERPKFNECLSKNELLELSKLSKYNGMINVNFINSTFFQKLSNIIGKNIFEKTKKLILRNIDNDSLEFLTNCEMKKLAYLDLSYKYYKTITNPESRKDNIDIGIRNLSKCKFIKLIKLDLSGNKISDKGLFFLSRCNFPFLADLRLNNNEFTSYGLEIIGQSKFKDIGRIELSYNKINDEGMKNFCKCEFKNLRVLVLENNLITDVSVEYLINSYFKNIIHLCIDNNLIEFPDKFRDKLKLKYSSKNTLK